MHAQPRSRLIRFHTPRLPALRATGPTPWLSGTTLLLQGNED
jgi:hypothetical protein